jgi:hypothetical protein
VKKKAKKVPVIEVDEIEAESGRIDRETANGIDPKHPGPRLFCSFFPAQEIRLVMRRQEGKKNK